jgi:hypothetical protein
MAARPTVVQARICWKSAVEMARLIDAGLAICFIFGEAGSWGGRIDSGGSCGVVFNASNRFGASLAGARFFFGFRPRLLGIASSMPPASTTPQARPRRGPPPRRLRRRLHRGDHAGTRPRNWAMAGIYVPLALLLSCLAERADRARACWSLAHDLLPLFAPHDSGRPMGARFCAEVRILLPQPAIAVSTEPKVATSSHV